MDNPKLNRRIVAARRTLAVGTIAATALGATAASAGMTPDADSPGWIRLAQAEGEAATSGEGEGEASVVSGEGEAAASGEGEGEAAASGEGEGESAASGEGEGEGEGEGGSKSIDSGTSLSRDLGFMEGHLRAGMVLYEAGDLQAAKTHMGHPIKEKYDAVAEPLADRGYDRLRSELTALAEAAEAEAPLEEIRPLYDSVHATIEEARDELPTKTQLTALAMLTLIAAEEYAVAVEGGEISNLHEYQDSWGFLRVVEAEAGELAGSEDGAVAEAAGRILEYLAATDAAYGDIQGEGEFEMDPSILYGAASRMELAAMGVQ